jgi:hypothetical protein
MKLDTLFETPQTIADLDDPKELDLLILSKNKALYEMFMGKKYQFKKLLFSLTYYAEVYQLKSEFFCLDHNLGKVTYYMRYKVDSNKVLNGQYVWQSLVWTDPKVHADYLIGVASKIFWEYLFNKFNVIVTDSEQTWKGRRFWEYRIGEALKKNLFVYFFNFQTKELVPLTDFDELYDYQEKYDIWGLTKSHQLKRMVISQIDLQK